MDTKPTLIGYGVKHGNGNGGKPNGNGVKGNPRPKPEMVDIYVGSTFVREMRFSVLTRFSAVASERFPRPKTDTTTIKTVTPQPKADFTVPKTTMPKTSAAKFDEAGKGLSSKKWSDDDGEKINLKKATEQVRNLSSTSGGKVDATNPGMTKGDQINLEKVTEQVNNLSLTSSGEINATSPKSTEGGLSDKAKKESKPPATLPILMVPKVATVPIHMAHKGAEAAKSSTSSALLPKKQLVLGDAELVLPEIAAVRTCLDWMIENQAVHGDQKLSAFHVAKTASLASRVKMYQAVLSLGMRPFPRHLESTLMDIVTEAPPTAGELRFIYDRLPECKVLTRVITSCIQHEEKRQYSAEQHKLISDMVAGDDWLNARFTQIEEFRIARRRENTGKKRMERGWAELEKVSAVEEAELGLRSTGGIQPASTKQHVELGGRQRNQRQQKAGSPSGNATAANDGKESASTTEKVPDTTKPKPDKFLEAQRKVDEAAAKLKAEAKNAGNGRGPGSKHVPGA